MYVDRLSFLAQRRAELLMWSGERTGPTLTSLPLAGSRQAETLLLRALLPSVSNELTIPAVPTPPLLEPGRRSSGRTKGCDLTPENRDECHINVVLRDGRKAASSIFVWIGSMSAECCEVAFQEVSDFEMLACLATLGDP